MTVNQPGSSPPQTMQVTLNPIDKVNLLVQDSQTKCAYFVDSLFAETAGSGFVLDILSTATSALATVFTPLATVHALSASSTILGAAKTGISANYLNTLSISHITQAIQSTYTTNITGYINTLSNADPTKINVYQERSKILSYHASCSLASAEGTISSTLQTTAPAGQGLSLTHTVSATENNAGTLAQDIVNDIKNSPDFSKAGITASVSGIPSANGAIITLTNPNSVTLTVRSVPSSLTQYIAGTNTLAIIGKPSTGNTITIAGPPATQQPSGGTQPSGGGAQTAPARPAGAALK